MKKANTRKLISINYFATSYIFPIFALRYILIWSRLCCLAELQTIILPVASLYTVLTPVWSINVPTVSTMKCNATGKRNRFSFLLHILILMVKAAPLSNSIPVDKKFIGYGHYELRITNKNGSVLTAVTGDIDLIERLNSESEEEREKATAEAIAFVREASL